MKFQVRLAGIPVLMICLLAVGVVSALADHGGTRDALTGLKRAITQASAPTLTTQQETDLNALITAYKDALPDEADAALEAAREAYDAAILAGDQAAAQTQIGIITTRTAALQTARLTAQAKFQIAVLANLKAGGQLDLLKTKLGDDRLLGLVESLIGQGPGGGPGGRR